MARTRNAVKRQKVATVVSTLFNPDVVFLLAGLLDARDLCQVSLTCKALGGKRANAVDGLSPLSLVEEAARRLFESASEWERSCLRKYLDEGWIELYHHLLMLRSKLTFDQLVGSNIQHAYGGEWIIRTIPVYRLLSSAALCSNHVMRSGKHFAVFACHGGIGIGVVRPVRMRISDFPTGEVNSFHSSMDRFWGYLIGQRIARWADSNVHCCYVSPTTGNYVWHDWANYPQMMSIDGLQSNTPIGLLLDLDEGTLSAYQNNQRLVMLKDGLSGEYCWYASVYGAHNSISIKRGLPPGEQRAG